MSLFADKTGSVADIRTRLTVAARSYFAGVVLSDDYLYGMLLAAEKDASHDLRVFLEPTEVFPTNAQSGPSAEDLASITDAAGNVAPWAEEPAYDYDPQFFEGNNWGYLVTRQSPVIQVRYIRFSYPAPTNTFFDIPLDWIRLDKKFGHVRLVPGTSTFAAPLSAFMMQVMGGGRGVPNMIMVRYQAGLQNAAADYPDLVDTIKKMCVLRVIEDQYAPASGSISADGLSRSINLDVGKFQESIDAKLEKLRESIHGVRMGFL